MATTDNATTLAPPAEIGDGRRPTAVDAGVYPILPAGPTKVRSRVSVWNRALQAARGLRHLGCSPKTLDRARPSARYLDEHGPVPGLEFCLRAQIATGPVLLYDLPGFSLSGAAACGTAPRCARRNACTHSTNFDLVHQVNFMTFREPGYLWTLDAPFVWGPWGGGAELPLAFLADGRLVEGPG